MNNHYANIRPLPAVTEQMSPFIARDEELAQMEALLANSACRLITISGVGGVGKTRLALRTLEIHAHTFKHGGYFVPLVSLDDPALLAVTIVDALQLPIAGRNNAQSQLLDHLHDKNLLLVLDNFEHLLESSAFLSDLLSAAPGVKLLVTSREPLSLAEEWLLRVEEMAYPKHAGSIELETYPAAQLFLQSARRVLPSFQFSTDPVAVTRICQLVEGLPLALELAASWLRVVPPGEIALQIEHNLDFLTSSLRNTPERHRSIRVVFEQAWEPLSPQEQRVLMWLSIFRGGFTLKAAQFVAGATLPLLVGLIEKSLLRKAPSERFDMHELLRQFANEKLREFGEFERARREHLAYFVQYTEQAQEQLLGSRRVSGLRSFINDIDNIRLALDWSERSDVPAELQLRLTSAMYSFWQARGDFLECRARIEAAVERVDADRNSMFYARVLYAAAGVTWWMGNYGPSLDYLNPCLALAEQLNDLRFVGNCLRNRGLVFVSRGDHALARADFERALLLLRQEGDDWGSVLSLAGIEHTNRALNDNAGALSLAQLLQIEQNLIDTWQGHALPLGNLQAVANDPHGGEHMYLFSSDTTGSIVEWDQGKQVMGDAFYKLGKLALNKHNFERTEAYLKDALMIYYECGYHQGVAEVLDTFSRFARRIERFDKASMLLAASARLYEVLGIDNAPVSLSHNREEITAMLMRHLGKEYFETLWFVGRQMSLRDIINQALDGHWSAI